MNSIFVNGTIIIGLVFIATTYGLQCFSCNHLGLEPNECNSSPPDNAYLETCKDFVTHCAIQTGEVLGTRYLQRYCALTPMNDSMNGECVDLPGGCHGNICQISRQECYCVENKCNGAFQLKNYIQNS